MNARKKWRDFALALGLLALTGTALADEVFLANGDRITGKIVMKDENVLVMNTDYAGELKIRWSDVTKLQSNDPVWVYLTDGTRMKGRLLMDPDSKLVVDSSENLRTGGIPVQEVRYINPPTELSGEGVALSGRANLGFASSSGNTDTEKWYINAEAMARTRDNRYTLGGEARRAEDQGVETESNWLGYMKYDHFLRKQWYAYANGNFENDEFKDIRLRTTLGVGTGYQFYETPRLNLLLEGGLSYVNTDFNDAEDDSYPAARAALKYDQFLFKSNIQLFHNNEVYFDVQNSENIFLRSQTGLRFPLVNRLNATLQYDYDWENEPAPGRASSDKKVLVTLGYTW